MRMPIFAVAVLAVGVWHAYAQGVFLFYNAAAPTRLGSVNGPFAGTNIYAQMFAGESSELLLPIENTVFHLNGIANGGLVIVPEMPPYQIAYVQMVAWDSALWGSTFATVPANYIGRTDIVTVPLSSGEFPEVAFAPRFTQPAVVPPIPEPSVWSLALLGGLLSLRCFGRRWTVTR